MYTYKQLDSIFSRLWHQIMFTRILQEQNFIYLVKSILSEISIRYFWVIYSRFEPVIPVYIHRVQCKRWYFCDTLQARCNPRRLFKTCQVISDKLYCTAFATQQNHVSSVCIFIRPAIRTYIALFLYGKYFCWLKFYNYNKWNRTDIFVFILRRVFSQKLNTFCKADQNCIEIVF